MGTRRDFVVKPRETPGGTVTIPGDKSVTHRIFLLGSWASGTTRVRGANRGDDCMRTLAAMRSLGVEVEDDGVTITLRGRDGAFAVPDGPLDMGNSGTGTRLLAGLLATQKFSSTLTGDESLKTRPMGRVVTPLRKMGAVITGNRDGSLLPITIEGGALEGIEYSTPVASAQVKSAVLLAGLGAAGETVVTEPAHSRDHTERMMAAMGADIVCEGTSVRLQGGGALRGLEMEVGGDPSSAAFLIVAGLLIPDAEIAVDGLLDNPTRTAFLDVLDRMGANLERIPLGDEGPEKRVRVIARYGPLRATEVSGAEIPALIDEIPILAVAGATARGNFRVRDAAELRVKESDRIATTVAMLRAFGVEADEDEDGFVLQGPKPGKKNLKGAKIDAAKDHRIAMAAVVAALAAKGKSRIEDVACVETSFPEFLDLFRALGLEQSIRLEEK